MRQVATAAPLAAAAALPAPTALLSQEPICTSRTEHVSGDQRKSLEQIRFDALQQARAGLLREQGVRIESAQQVVQQNTGAETSLGYASSILLSTSGSITRDTVLSFSTNDGGRTWLLEYHGCMVVQEGLSDPQFILRVRLDKNPPTYGFRGPGSRDSIVVWANTSKPAYYTIFQRSGDTLSVLYPSSAIGLPRRRLIPEEDTVRFPPPPAVLRVTLEGNAERATAWMIVVATKEEYPLTMLPPGYTRSFHRISFQQYMNWLNRIPLEGRAVVEYAYDVVRTAEPH
jgi:hypothetical protein